VIIARVRRTLQQRRLVEKGMHVLAACSGGPDSTAMLYCLARLAPELGFTLASASVDHGLREAAAREVELVGRQTRSIGAAFYPLKVAVASGPSLQAEARTARYRVLKQLAEQIGAQRIAVGHTQDDQAETVIMRILRGAGLEGLAAIDPLRMDGVIRPLIDCRRPEVHRYARENCSEIADDPSNLDERFERVRIRNRLLPVLEAEDPAIWQHLADLADQARETARMSARRAQRLLRKVEPSADSLKCAALRMADGAVRRHALRIWIERQTGVEPSRSHIDQVDQALADGGEVWLPGQWAVIVTADRITCVRR
jgi:tRNA(Ile)-lysidine synthase